MAETEVKIKVSANTSHAKTDFEALEKSIARTGASISKLTKELADMQKSTTWVGSAKAMWDDYERSTEKALRSATRMADGIAKGVDAIDSLRGALEGLPGPFGEAASFGGALGAAVDKYSNIFGSGKVATDALTESLENLNFAWTVLIHNLEVDRLNFKATTMLGKSQLSFTAFDASSMFKAAESQVAAQSKDELDNAYYLRGEEARYAAIDKAKAKAAQLRDFDASRKAAERARLGAGIGYGAEEDSQSVTGMFGDFMGGLGSGITGAISDFGGAADSVVGKGSDAAKKQDAVSEKFFRDLQDNTKATGAAFSALSSGMAASVEAAITGSQSIGAAFKSAAAAALKATAVESTIKALYHTAAGVGSLALGPLGGMGAAAHFKAAGLYALTAVAAGAASAGLGGGGGGGYAGAGASGGGGYSRPAASSGGGGDIVNINIGYGFIGEEKKLGVEIGRAWRSAKRSGGARESQAISHD